MATWNAIITAGSDDAKQAAGGVMTVDDSPIILSAGTQWGGFRFLSCPIAPGDAIVSAEMTLNLPNSANDDPGGLGIYSEWYNYPAAFTTGTNNISARNRSSSVVAWNGTNIGTGDQVSPDLAVLVDEVINGGIGYVQGYPLAFILDPTGTTNFRYTSYEGSTTLCARLTVEYTPAAAAAAGPLVNALRLKSKLRGLV